MSSGEVSIDVDRFLTPLPEESVEPVAKRRKLSQSVSVLPQTLKYRRRYRPDSRQSEADSVLVPLDGFEFRELTLTHQNPLRTGPPKPPPDPGIHSTFCKRLYMAQGLELPVEVAHQDVLEPSERIVVKLHRHLGKLATTANVPELATTISAPSYHFGGMPGDPLALFSETWRSLTEYNKEVAVFAAVARHRATSRTRAESIVSVDATQMDATTLSATSRRSSAHSAVTVPSPVARSVSFESMLAILRKNGADMPKTELLAGLTTAQPRFNEALLTNGCATFDAYLQLAQREELIQLDGQRVRLVKSAQTGNVGQK